MYFIMEGLIDSIKSKWDNVHQSKKFGISYIIYIQRNLILPQRHRILKKVHAHNKKKYAHHVR
jgi:hypothetical protein